jgi:hypothetical protein
VIRSRQVLGKHGNTIATVPDLLRVSFLEAESFPKCVCATAPRPLAEWLIGCGPSRRMRRLRVPDSVSVAVGVGRLESDGALGGRRVQSPESTRQRDGPGTRLAFRVLSLVSSVRLRFF